MLNLRKDFALTPEHRADARQALLLLEGSGLSMLQAVRLGLQVNEAKGKGPGAVAWNAALQAFLADTRARGRRAATLDFYEHKLAGFGSELGKDWQSVTRGELERWLAALEVGMAMRAMVFRALRAFYRFAQRQDPPWCGVPPTEGLQLGSVGEPAEIDFYPTSVCQTWLEKVDVEARAALAVQLFAGVRPEEVSPRWPGKERLAWSHFDLDGQIVRVPASVSKTRRPRILEDLPPALWLWLGETPEEKRVGPIWAGHVELLRDRLQSGLAKEVKWISRGPRKTFATHAVAFTGDVGKVALWLGHEGSPTMLHRHYRGLVTKAQGAKFFGQQPAR